MNITDKYHNNRSSLDNIDIVLIQKAQLWVYEILCKAKKCKDNISGLLKGELLNINTRMQYEKLLNQYSFKKTSDFIFRTECKKDIKNKSIFLDRISYYWWILELTYPDIRFNMQADGIHKIIITSQDMHVSYPPNIENEVIEYIGFYPRSKADIADKFGVVSMKLFPKLRDEKGILQGEFEMTAFYRDFNSVLSGKFREENKLTFLRTKENDSGNHSAYGQYKFNENDKSMVIQTQYIWHRSQADKDFILGVMTTTNRQMKFGFAGACVFMSKDYYEKNYLGGKELKLHHLDSMAKGNTQIPPLVGYYLWGQRISTNFHEYLSEGKKQLPFIDQVKVIQTLKGKYLGHRLLQNDNLDIKLSHFFVEIEENGYVIFNKDDDSKNGYIRYVNTEVQNGKYQIMIYIGMVESKLYHQQVICLEMESASDAILKGAFIMGGGVEPQAGKILLMKVDENFELPKDELFDTNHMHRDSHDRIANFFMNDIETLPGYTIIKRQKPIKIPYYLPKELSLFCVIKNNETDSIGFKSSKLLKMNLYITERSFILHKNYNGKISGNIDLSDYKLQFKALDSFQSDVIYISLPSPIDDSTIFSHATGIQTYYSNDRNVTSRPVLITPIYNPQEDFEAFNKNDLMNKFCSQILTHSDPLYKAYHYLYTSDELRINYSENTLNPSFPKLSKDIRHRHYYHAYAIASGVFLGSNNNTIDIDWGEVITYIQMAKQNHFMSQVLLSNEEYNMDKMLLHKLTSKMPKKEWQPKVEDIFKRGL